MRVTIVRGAAVYLLFCLLKFLWLPGNRFRSPSLCTKSFIYWAMSLDSWHLNFKVWQLILSLCLYLIFGSPCSLLGKTLLCCSLTLEVTRHLLILASVLFTTKLCGLVIHELCSNSIKEILKFGCLAPCLPHCNPFPSPFLPKVGVLLGWIAGLGSLNSCEPSLTQLCTTHVNVTDCTEFFWKHIVTFILTLFAYDIT